MIKFFAKRKYRKGFTLTETIVVVALIAIIMACVVAFGTPVRGMVRHTADKDSALTINKIMGDYVERRLSFANKMDIFVGKTYNSLDADIISAFNDDLNTINNDSTCSAGILVFKQALDINGDGVIDDTNDEYCFKLVDYKIPKGASSTLPSQAALIADDNLVFTDEFYGGLQNVAEVLCHDTVSGKAIDVNAANKAYITFRINSFLAKENGMIRPSDLKTLYSETKSAPTGNDIAKMNTILNSPTFLSENDFIAKETFSFAVENLKGTNKTEPVYTVPGDPTSLIDHYEIVSQPPVLNVRRYDDGTDIVIFYNIKKYKNF